MLAEGRDEFEDFEEKVQKYYLLKSAYEKAVDDKKKTIKKQANSKKEMRDMYQKFVPKCVSCQRNVGSLFEKKQDGANFHLIALCGDRDNPCKLNIDINMGNIIYLEKEKSEKEEELEKLIHEIIVMKNDELFGYVTEEEVVKKFDVLNDNLEMTTAFLRDILITYVEVVKNADKEQKIHDMESMMHEHVSTIKKHIDDFEKSGNKQFVKDAVSLYANEMQSNIQELFATKYSKIKMDFDPVDKEYVLNQTGISRFDMEYHGEYEVVRFEIGKELQTPESAAKGKPLVPESIPSNIYEMSALSTEEEDDNPPVGTLFEPFTPPDTPPTNNTESGPGYLGPESSESYHLAPSSSESYHLAPSTDDGDGDDSEIESDSDSDSDDDAPKQPIRIGQAIDTSSDSYIPPPPPDIDDAKLASSS